jgi:hypothetical protein
MLERLTFLRWLVTLGAACALLWPLVAEGQDFVVDQACDGFVPIGGTSLWYCDVSQEFVPEFSYLEIVELQTVDYQPSDGIGASLLVNIREGTPDGPILDTSLMTELPNGFEGITSFGFAGAVSLTPGEVHLIQLVYVSGSNWGFKRYGYVWDVCPEVDRFCENTMVNDDLWFREGVAGPSPVEPASWGTVKALYRGSGRAP